MFVYNLNYEITMTKFTKTKEWLEEEYVIKIDLDKKLQMSVD